MKDLSPFELLTLGPRPPSPVISAPSPTLSTSLSCSEDLNPTDEEAIRESSRKRIRKEIERFGRNIKQRLCCAIFEEEDNHANHPLLSITWLKQAHLHSMLTLMQGFGKLAVTASPRAIRILSWNYRGLGNPSAVLQCQKKAQEYKPDILFLMETKLAKDKGQDIFEKVWILEWMGSPSGRPQWWIAPWMAPRSNSQQPIQLKELAAC